jgi:hypothetical protein
VDQIPTLSGERRHLDVCAALLGLKVPSDVSRQVAKRVFIRAQENARPDERMLRDAIMTVLPSNLLGDMGDLSGEGRPPHGGARREEQKEDEEQMESNVYNHSSKILDPRLVPRQYEADHRHAATGLLRWSESVDPHEWAEVAIERAIRVMLINGPWDPARTIEFLRQCITEIERMPP